MTRTTEPVDVDEEARVRALQALDVLDTPEEDRFDRVTRLAAGLFGVPMAAVTLIDRERQFFKSAQGLAAGVSAPRSDAICEATIQGPGTLVVEDLASDSRFAGNPYVVGDPRARFYAGHPLETSDGQRVGTLCILDDRPRSLSAGEESLLRDLAMWVQQELTTDREIGRAAAVQQGLLPRRPPVLPGYDLAAACLPSRGVGGDFYDWYSLPGTGLGRVALSVVDVMGKGLAAAIITATVRAVLRSTARTGGPAVALDVAAEALAADLDHAATFVTAFHAHLDPATGLVRYADAGHGLAIVVRADGGVERLRSDDLPLGVGAGLTDGFRQHSDALAPGDTLVACSDGVLDLFDGTLAALADVETLVRSSAEAAEVVARVSRLAHHRTPPDDVTVVVVRRQAGA